MRLATSIRTDISMRYVLFGHSMGALVAFTAAQAVRAAGGAEPAGLILSGQVAPHRIAEAKPVDEMSDDQFVDILRSMQGTPKSLLEDQDFLSEMLPTLRADFAAYESFIPNSLEVTSLPITVISSVADAVAPYRDSFYWSQFTRGDFRFHVMEGAHFFLFSRSEEVSDLIDKELSRFTGLECPYFTSAALD